MIKAENHTVPGFSEEVEKLWKGRYTFVHAADPQLGFIDEKTGGTGLVWDEDLKRLEKAVEAVNRIRPRPKFFFINGDLVNAVPGSGPHKFGQEKDFFKAVEKSEIPVLVTCGNHDIGNEPTPASVKAFKNLFGDDYFSFYAGGIFCIALNSQYLYDSSIMKEESERQLNWLRSQLKRAKEDEIQHTVIFMHIPPFTSLPDEEHRRTNLPVYVRMKLLSEFADAGVEVVFSGHYHRNAGGIWEQDSDGGTRKIEVVVTSAIGMPLGVDKPGLSIVTVDEKEISHRFFALEDVPCSAQNCN